MIEMITRQLSRLPQRCACVAMVLLGCPSLAWAGDPVERHSLPLFLEASGPVQLRDTPSGNGVFMSPFSANLVFCSVNGCYQGQHLAAQVLVNMTTGIDATVQEVGLFVNVTSRSGKAEQWKPRTAYAKGTQVQSVDGALYEADAGGTSGQSTPPQSHGSAVQDGSMSWSFRSEVVHNGKTALGAGLNMVRGSGQGWSLVSDLTVQNGVGDQNAFGYENDCANYNKDSDFGVPFLMTCFFQGGQGTGTYPMFAYRYVAAGDGSSYGAHYGDFFNGAVTIKDATIADATNALNTIRVVAGSKHESVFSDRSSSIRSIDIGGSYRSAIDISDAKVQEAQIKGHAWQVAPDGTMTAAGYRTSLNPPGNSSESCAPGEIRFGEDFIYLCVRQNKWKRAALNSW